MNQNRMFFARKKLKQIVKLGYEIKQKDIWGFHEEGCFYKL